MSAMRFMTRRWVALALAGALALGAASAASTTATSAGATAAPAGATAGTYITGKYLYLGHLI